MMIDTTIVRVTSTPPAKKVMPLPKPSAGRMAASLRRYVWPSMPSAIRFAFCSDLGRRQTSAKRRLSSKAIEIEGYRFGALIADKGLDSNDFIEWVESLEAVVVIPPRKTDSSSGTSIATCMQTEIRSSGSSVGSSSTGGSPLDMRKQPETTAASCIWPQS